MNLKNLADKSTGNNPTTNSVSQIKALVEKKHDTILQLFENDSIKFEKFKSNVIRLFSSNSNLAKCTPLSILGAAMQSAYLNLDLDPNLGQAYVIARWNKNLNGKGQGGHEATFQTGYQGLTELIRRSGNLKSFNTVVVYENEPFTMTYNLEGIDFSHQPLAPSNRGTKKVGVYMVTKLIDGGTHFEWMWAEEVLAVKEISQSKDSGFSPWNGKDIVQEAMWKKTVLRRASKSLPKTTQLALALKIEEALEYGKVDFSRVVDNNDAIMDAYVNEEEQPVQPQQTNNAQTTKEHPDNQTAKPQQTNNTHSHNNNSKEQPVQTNQSENNKEQPVQVNNDQVWNEPTITVSPEDQCNQGWNEFQMETVEIETANMKQVQNNNNNNNKSSTDFLNPFDALKEANTTNNNKLF